MQRIKLRIGNWLVRVIHFIARKAKIDLLPLGLHQNGIGSDQNFMNTGEDKFLRDDLKQFILNPNVIFDVGANKGQYSTLLIQHYPKASIYSFEPNPNTFEVIKNSIGDKINLFNIGMGESLGQLDLHFDKNDETSVQATSDPEILKEIAKTENITSVKIEIDTIDNFCATHKIEEIDLLKIDTEGFEIEVIDGAQKMLSASKIKAIQFEFNEVNIIRKHFLKDFYDLLPGFDLYRIHPKGLVPLGEWTAKHEIFLFQNIVAVRR